MTHFKCICCISYKFVLINSPPMSHEATECRSETEDIKVCRFHITHQFRKALQHNFWSDPSKDQKSDFLITNILLLKHFFFFNKTFSCTQQPLSIFSLLRSLFWKSKRRLSPCDKPKRSAVKIKFFEKQQVTWPPLQFCTVVLLN